jgi:hypothetical protein
MAKGGTSGDRRVVVRASPSGAICTRARARQARLTWQLRSLGTARLTRWRSLVQRPESPASLPLWLGGWSRSGRLRHRPQRTNGYSTVHAVLEWDASTEHLRVLHQPKREVPSVRRGGVLLSVPPRRTGVLRRAGNPLAQAPVHRHVVLLALRSGEAPDSSRDPGWGSQRSRPSHAGDRDADAEARWAATNHHLCGPTRGGRQQNPAARRVRPGVPVSAHAIFGAACGLALDCDHPRLR